jgi:phosphoadenosine phosphosulfate reductase
LVRGENLARWCKSCNREAFADKCDLCGTDTEEDLPVEIYWCRKCEVPIIKTSNAIDKKICPLCGEKTEYLAADLRPVFPEERLLFEILTARPLNYINKSVWASTNRYYINNLTKTVTKSIYAKANVTEIREKLNQFQIANSNECFEEYIAKFVLANQDRLNYLKDEASAFINKVAQNYPAENLVISFSGGKDSTVVADLVIKALGNPSLVHIFGDTTLEFPSTIEYAKRYRASNHKAIFKTAKNKEQEFKKVCEDIGPPARMLRWCCSMFKTGPITRILNNLYHNQDILTFYGIRKCESVSRSKYNRLEDSSEAVKIQKQAVASPIFLWHDIDIWLYLLGEQIDFNEAYRLGYDRVGCWCCPNNNARAQFLSRIYMPEESEQWRDFLIRFAKQIGKPDPEVYVDTEKWKARQGGNGVAAADDVKIRFTNCTTEEHSKIYQLTRPITDSFYELFIPFGIVAKELGRKLINEIIVLDIKTKVPILAIQPFKQDGYEYSVKIKTLNVKDHESMQRMVSYQIRKYNACRKCLKCESLCKNGAITVKGDAYRINVERCSRCRKCVTAKYLDKGCLMEKYLYVKRSLEKYYDRNKFAISSYK